MIASVINALLVAVGSAVGLLFKNRIHESSSRYIMVGLGLCVFAIGVDSTLKSEDTLCVIICMVLGILLGEALRIEDHLDQLGETLKKRFSGKENSRFTEGFMTATLLFCVGSMAIVGSLEAGINGNYSIILSKSVIDCVTAVTFAAAMGVGVVFSAFTVLIYQGLITLLAIWVGPFLPEAVILEMSGVGGLLIVGLSINMLGLMGENRVRVGNMLPAVFLPIAYVPFVDWLSGVIG
ncbi:MAG: DUF554 domain-containing protein [Eubacteriales bacterium]|nr:DUF554 domain-containing protein [Eubacteriales bacterium]